MEIPSNIRSWETLYTGSEISSGAWIRAEGLNVKCRIPEKVGCNRIIEDPLGWM